MCQQDPYILNEIRQLSSRDSEGVAVCLVKTVGSWPHLRQRLEVAAATWRSATTQPKSARRRDA